MKSKLLLLSSLVVLTASLQAAAATAPKKILLITTSTGFRHSSIEVVEKVLRELAAKTGEFTITSTSDSPDYPNYAAGRGGASIAYGTATQQAAVNKVLGTDLAAANQKATAAKTALTQASLSDPASVNARATELAAAEQALATARAGAFASLQASPNKLSGEQIAIMTGAKPAPAVPDLVTKVLANYMSLANLNKFDAIYFDSTVGELPFPSRDDFFKWVSDGHAVMANHAGSDSMHQTPEYAKMLGGEFLAHGQQAVGTIVNFDSKHPATANWGAVREVYEELYMFRPNNYDRTQVHSLLTMVEQPADGRGTPGTPVWYPVAWTKMYGKGRVFFTSLGHREDVVDPTWKDANGERRNAPEVAMAFQEHLLGGIRWALGLREGSVDAQIKTQLPASAAAPAAGGGRGGAGAAPGAAPAAGRGGPAPATPAAAPAAAPAR
jgi:type 1 glutamine amidotransferase